MAIDLKVVAFDQGHGGDDCGAMYPPFHEPEPNKKTDPQSYAYWARMQRAHAARAELVEKDWVMEESSLIANMLVGPFSPFYVRVKDEDLGLSEAAQVAASAGAKLALALHVNWSDNPSSHGLFPLYMPGDATGKAMAEAISRHAPPQLQRYADAATADRWPRAANVMRPYKRLGIDVVLIEFGYASNSMDRAFLNTPYGMHACALAAYAGVLEWWRVTT